MANAWGELSWSIGDFGAQNDATVETTSVSLTASLGNPTYEATVDFGWGNNAWGEVAWNTNEINALAELSGIQTTLTLGDETVVGEINTGWGRYEWGTFAWGIGGTVLAEGQQLSVSLDSVTTIADANAYPSGQQLNFQNLGTLTFDIGATVDATTQLLRASLDSVTTTANANIIPTGIQLTASEGDLEGYNTTGWGRLTWGSEVWGATGYWATAELTGISLSANLGTAVLDAVSFIDVTGEQLTIAEGIVDPSPDATVVGIGLSASVAVGTVVSAEANAYPTGQQLTAAQGTAILNAVSYIDVTGISLSTAVGTVFAGGSTEVVPTGIQFAIELGNGTNIQIWKAVDTGTSVAYTAVSTGSSVTWKNVDTAA